MDYFKILNLNKEPFSNSPEPEFFYQSSQHLGCLQKLELAIRLRRGLNVVMGEVGTGKTTLCRQLILRFTETEEDRNEVETHLLLDPSFSTPREFLAGVAIGFGLAADAAESEWQLKESIKDYLFRKGVDEKKTVVLIIDEGQKIPEFCLELLREFLNYETNEYKLLQIVIFAQNEFREILKNHENFADRVNQYYTLRPLNFRETRRMIRFRMTQAGKSTATPFPFTLPGIWAIYRETGGYPRRIITLCHQVMLALIIQNRTRAGWLMVRSCADRVSPEVSVRQRRIVVAASLLAAIALFWMAGLATGLLEWQTPWQPILSGNYAVITAEQPPAPAGPKAAAPAPASIPAPAPPQAAPAPAPLNMEEPDLLGRLIVNPGETIYGMLYRIYGGYGAPQLRAFVRANPQVKDLNLIQKGDVLTFPAIPYQVNPLPPGRTWVAVAAKETLGEACEVLRRYPEHEPGIRLFPYWNPREGLVFALLTRNSFPDATAADGFIRGLPAEFSSGARVIARWPEETNYYAR